MSEPEVGIKIPGKFTPEQAERVIAFAREVLAEEEYSTYTPTVRCSCGRDGCQYSESYPG